MNTYTHHTTPAQFIEAAAIHFAYRRFGKKSGVPLVLNMHLKGTMGHCDFDITDGLDPEHEAILFNKAGISGTNGETPDSIYRMAHDEKVFVDTPGLKKIDPLGFSMGALIVQSQQRCSVLHFTETVKRIVFFDFHKFIFEFTLPLLAKPDDLCTSKDYQK